MDVAIDDTYGPITGNKSKFVTPARRTHAAVLFEDQEATQAKCIVAGLLAHASKRLKTKIEELHFTDIYNRTGPWKVSPERYNLAVIKYMMIMYEKNKWRVLLQTIDDRTLADHPQLANIPSIEGLDPTNRSELSLILLLIKLRIATKALMPPINLYVDGGIKSVGEVIGKDIFKGWNAHASGRFSDSKAEPLLQIADFIAFVINRCTYLFLKNSRTKLDNRFLSSAGRMGINSADLVFEPFDERFGRSEFDLVHAKDRAGKGL